jgi:hypothetical protein
VPLLAPAHLRLAHFQEHADMPVASVLLKLLDVDHSHVVQDARAVNPKNAKWVCTILID